MSDVITAVCEYYQISEAQLLGPQRSVDLVFKRQVAVFLAREMTPQSILQIGKRFNRDHSTVVHGHAKIAAAIAGDAVLAGDIRAIAERLRGDGSRATYTAAQQARLSKECVPRRLAETRKSKRWSKGEKAECRSLSATMSRWELADRYGVSERAIRHVLSQPSHTLSEAAERPR